MAESLVRTLEAQPLNTSSSSKPKIIFRLFLKTAGVLLLIVLLSGIILYFPLISPLRRLMVSVRKLESSARQVEPYLKAQDLAGTQGQLAQVKTDLETVKADYSRLKWLKAVPLARNYYLDGERGFTAAGEVLSAGNVAIEAIAPYADIIGLKGLATTGNGEKTAQDRINFIVNTLDKIKPQLSTIGDHLAKAGSEVDGINPNRYPEEFKGMRVRDQITQGILLLDQASTLVNDAKPLLESAPYILGLDGVRKYLVIFQNDAELRPTGGFMTAYAVISVSKGKIGIVESNDIYFLDERFPKKLPAPEPIKKYLPKVPYWYLRDQNISPDFKVSMETFFPNYLLTKSPEVDGIFTVDTQVLVDLLKITGPIGVPGFGNYSAENDKRCNCPNVFYELELVADVEGPVVWDSISGQIVFAPRNYGARKSFIGPMMHSVLSNVMAQPKGKMGEMFNTAMRLIGQKHIQFYFPDSKIQDAVEIFNLAGRVRPIPDGWDYLMVVDTNFAGAKTNAWVNYNADIDTQISGDGNITKTLTLTYKNPQQYFADSKTNLKLNGVFRDWLRVYVPAGSKLLEAKGFETGQTVGEDLGKTVFEGFFTLTPLNTKVVSFKYELPFKVKTPYKALIQKQSGSKDFPYVITLNGRKLPEVILSSDKELNFPF
ncbi:hypothetical protein A2395_02955 [Candidatus Amesbacteria bacterium RIFOXYB1_FULL_47_9]|uniref:DUF4012 domain-containing protein n=1 Tax=Candidatus Amesbacteria bacterium RIFOXYB1_FULL_47_9 TaxID=1797266 RepID=A0A1F4ZWC1_9BACT|nr:MAG: hypothetical protein A2395_02955 [Candidatus Amesbacteria bacterium RIFOXYB1_FULL_47_9]